MSAQTRSEIAELLSRYGLAPVHRLGQHFLADANITRKIVHLAAVGPDSQVVEVGAGTGTLTRALAVTGARVVSYEVDGGLGPVLAEVLSGFDVEVRLEDVMDVDLGAVLEEGEWVMVANLPYNVGTPLLLDALRHVPQLVKFVVMVQREVADRLVAKPGSAGYGMPSLITSIHGRARLEFTVSPQVFIPPPRVGSAVVVIERTPAAAYSERAIELASGAFNQRRKMLRRSLSAEFDDPVQALTRAGIDPTARAEDLGATDFLRLASL